MDNTDHYRSLSTRALLMLAREQGINPGMAVALAERLENYHEYDEDPTSNKAMGGRYAFKQRSEVNEL